MMNEQDNIYASNDGLTILIVEDDPGISTMLAELIEGETPHRAVLASDGVTALKIARRVNPSLFLLDYILPGMNGIDLHDRLHAIYGLEHVPTVMISANYPKGEVDKRQIIGLRKPFELDTFLNVIEQVLSSGGYGQPLVLERKTGTNPGSLPKTNFSVRSQL